MSHYLPDMDFLNKYGWHFMCGHEPQLSYINKVVLATINDQYHIILKPDLKDPAINPCFFVEAVVRAPYDTIPYIARLVTNNLRWHPAALITWPDIDTDPLDLLTVDLSKGIWETEGLIKSLSVDDYVIIRDAIKEFMTA